MDGFSSRFEVGTGEQRYEYVAQHPDPETAFKIGIELSRMIGEPVAAMAGGAGGGENVTESLRKAANIFLQKCDPGTMFGILKKVLAYVEVQPKGDKGKFMLNQESALKLHFQGRHGDMLEVFIQTLVFQQADFFLAIKRTLTEMMSKVKA